MTLHRDPFNLDLRRVPRQVLIFVDIVVLRPLLASRALSRDAAVLLFFPLLVLPVTFALAAPFTDRVDAAAVRLARFAARAANGRGSNQGDPTAWASAKAWAGSREGAAWLAAYTVLIAVAFIPSAKGRATCTSLFGGDI